MQPIEPRGEEKESGDIVKVQTLIHILGILYIFTSIIINFYVHFFQFSWLKSAATPVSTLLSQVKEHSALRQQHG